MNKFLFGVIFGITLTISLQNMRFSQILALIIYLLVIYVCIRSFQNIKEMNDKIDNEKS